MTSFGDDKFSSRRSPSPRRKMQEVTREKRFTGWIYISRQCFAAEALSLRKGTRSKGANKREGEGRNDYAELRSVYFGWLAFLYFYGPLLLDRNYGGVGALPSSSRVSYPFPRELFIPPVQRREYAHSTALCRAGKVAKSFSFFQLAQNLKHSMKYILGFPHSPPLAPTPPHTRTIFFISLP